VIAPVVNAYLLRFYFQIRGMPEPELIARLHALQAKQQGPTQQDKTQQQPSKEGAAHG